MKLLSVLQNSTREMMKTIKHYPFTTGFLSAAVVVNTIMIEEGSSFFLESLLMTFLVGAMATVVAKLLGVEYFKDRIKGISATGIAFALTGLFYLGLRNYESMNQMILTRTAVITFMFVIAYVLIPSLKGGKSVNHHLMATVKSYFTTVLFAGVLFAGIAAILGATDQLLFSINNNLYGHVANIIFILFAPIFFLSMEHRFDVPRFFANLLTFVAIPLLGVFTLILVIYIVTNLRAGFWTDNLLEPMLVSYSIVVLLIIFLVSTLDHKIVSRFLSVFPKVILIIFLFQTIASILKIGESGMTHGRYYAILYGIFSVIAASLISIKREQKNHWIAMVLIIFSLISVIPPVDAFSYSIRSQENRIEEVLEDNEMLVNGEVIPTGNLNREEQTIVTESMQYLEMVGALNRLEWLPEEFNYYMDFEEVFGFPPYFHREEPNGAEYVFYYREHNLPVSITGFEVMVPVSFDRQERSPGTRNESPYRKSFDLDGEDFVVRWDHETESFMIHRENESEQPVIQYTLEEFEESLESLDRTPDEPLDPEKVSFELSGEGIKAKMILNQFEHTRRRGDEWYYGEVLFLIGLSDSQSE